MNAPCNRMAILGGIYSNYLALEVALEAGDGILARLIVRREDEHVPKAGLTRQLAR